MKIPTEPVARKAFYSEVLYQCLATRNDRWALYRQLRNYYLFGTKDASGCMYNKIAAAVDTLWSFLYSSDTSKFAIHLGTSANEGDLMKVPALRAEINDQWRASGTSLIFSVGGKYSLVYGAMLFKTLWHQGKAKSFVVEPHQFGVYREDVMDIDDQEAFVHCYQITKTQLANMLEGNPRASSILSRVGSPVSDDSEPTGGEPNGLQRIILSSGVNTGVGPANGGGVVEGGLGNAAAGGYDYTPNVEAEMVEMHELMIWNDEINDYQIVTIAAPDIIVFDRANFYVDKTHPYSIVRPEHDVYDYFWGVSFLARLTGLQDWRVERIEQIRSLLSKQVDPPYAISGMSGIAEEKMQAIRRAGGQISSNQPTLKVENLAPALPSGVFTEIQEIDAMFADAAGMGPLLQGESPGSVRSKGQADMMARLGSSRVKQKALVVEEAAARVATLMLKNVQEYSKQRFQSKEADPSTKGPLTFIAEQFTSDFEVRVDSHSSSPVFVEDQKQTAVALLKVGAIDQSTLLDMFDPPNLQELQAKLVLIQKKQAEEAKITMGLEEKIKRFAPAPRG